MAARLIGQPFLSAHFVIQVHLGPDTAFTTDAQGAVFPAGQPAFDGPIVLLVGPRTVSAAENFSQMLMGAGRLSAVVGRTSAGTSGNITGVQLPGGFGFTYTGRKVLNRLAVPRRRHRPDGDSRALGFSVQAHT